MKTLRTTTKSVFQKWRACHFHYNLLKYAFCGGGGGRLNPELKAQSVLLTSLTALLNVRSHFFVRTDWVKKHWWKCCTTDVYMWYLKPSQLHVTDLFVSGNYRKARKSQGPCIKWNEKSKVISHLYDIVDWMHFVARLKQCGTFPIHTLVVLGVGHFQVFCLVILRFILQWNHTITIIIGM